MEELSTNLEKCKSVIDKISAESTSVDFNGMIEGDVQAMEESVGYIEKIVGRLNVNQDADFNANLNALLTKLVSLVQRITHIIKDYNCKKNIVSLDNRIKADMMLVMNDMNDIVTGFTNTFQRGGRSTTAIIAQGKEFSTSHIVICILLSILAILFVVILGLISPGALLFVLAVGLLIFFVIYFLHR